MIKAAIIGATGYAGQELVRILLRHPNAEVVSLGSRSYEGQRFSDVYPAFRGLTDLCCVNADPDDLADEADVIFLALPHGLASSKINDRVLNRAKVIDLGADFRLHDLDIYTEWYGVEHHAVSLLPEAIYGLPELHRDAIVGARLIANPGCYTTCSILTMAPLVAAGVIDPCSVIIDAKSGVTGAGRGLVLGDLYCECNESIKAYKVAAHRHTPEIEQELSLLGNRDITLSFTPHLTPMNRGILATCYANLIQEITTGELLELVSDFYKDEYFVRVLSENMLPETRFVKGTNFCDIGLKVDERTHRVIAMGAIDNLIKGAAGQAVQNMNLLFGLDEKTGLDMIADFPV